VGEMFTATRGFESGAWLFKQAQVRSPRDAVATHPALRRYLFWHSLAISIGTASAHDALFMHVGDDRRLVIGRWSPLHTLSPLDALDDLHPALLMWMLCDFQSNRWIMVAFPLAGPSTYCRQCWCIVISSRGNLVS
jgi:hypothetical protein